MQWLCGNQQCYQCNGNVKAKIINGVMCVNQHKLNISQWLWPYQWPINGGYQWHQMYLVAAM